MKQWVSQVYSYLYNTARSGNWYDFGFLIGAGSPLLGLLGRRSDKKSAK